MQKYFLAAVRLMSPVFPCSSCALLSATARRFVTLERVFAYYCRCIKNEPERFKFREAMGPKEYAIFCQECEITGEAKGKLSIIDSRRVFKRANMEVR